MGYTDLDFEIPNLGGQFAVSGTGVRAPNETVDFRLGLNDGISGQFDYGNKVSVIAGGAPQSVTPSYIDVDANLNARYQVDFQGALRSDGSTGFVIEGELNGQRDGGSIFPEYMTLGYKSSGGSWSYETRQLNESSKENLQIFGSRGAGANVQVRVGATSQLLNLYGYGTVVDVTLPESF